MLANSPKDSQLSPAETCALYYFPEIPCRGEKESVSMPRPATFVGGAIDHQEKASPASAAPKDEGQVRALSDEAFANGVEQGRTETMAASQERIEAAASALKAAMEAFARVRQMDIERMETETVKLALAIAKKIIGSAADSGLAITQVVNAAMQKVADPRQLTLRLNPADMDTVAAHKQELVKNDDMGAAVRLQGDESIQPGGCVIETALGDVDARLDQQIKMVEALLDAQLSDRPADE